MIYDSVEISIAEGGADEKDVHMPITFLSFFLFFFLYHRFVVKVQEIAWRASYGENKTQNSRRTNKGNCITNYLYKGRYRSRAHMRARKS